MNTRRIRKSRIDENQKITLTIGQLKKLVNESDDISNLNRPEWLKNVTRADDCVRKAIDYLGDVLATRRNDTEIQKFMADLHDIDEEIFKYIMGEY